MPPRPSSEREPALAAFRPALAYRAVVLALVLVAIGLLFEQLVNLLLLVVMTVIIALPIAATASWLQRFHVPRVLGALLSLLTGAVILALVLWLIVPSFISQVNSFVREVPSLVNTIDHTFGLKRGAIAKEAEALLKRFTVHPGVLLGPLSSIGLTVATAVGGLVVVLISAIYMAINPGPLVRGLVRLAPPDRRQDMVHVLERIRVAWLGWLRGVVLDMIVLGGLLFVGMKLIGLQFAVGFAVFSALMTVIPNYGSVISAVPPILFGLAHSLHEAVLVTVVYVVVNQIEGNVALPLIMGRSVSMHPALVAIGVLLAGALFGILGLFISIPLISLTLILVEELWIVPQERLESRQADPIPPAPLKPAG